MFLSIMGMYEYDASVFDGLELPTYTDEDQNIFTIDKDKLIQNILLNCAELEVVYPEISTMKLAIGVWSAAEFRTWEKLFATTMMAYNPIWNVDANVEHTNRVAGSDNRTITHYNTVGHDVTVTPNTTDERSVQGFNSAQWAGAEKNAKTGNVRDAGTVTDNGNVTDNNTDDHTTTFKERRTGNIGVTSTQSMIEQERNIAEFSIINYITQAFKVRFCLMVY